MYLIYTRIELRIDANNLPVSWLVSAVRWGSNDNSWIIALISMFQPRAQGWRSTKTFWSCRIEIGFDSVTTSVFRSFYDVIKQNKPNACEQTHTSICTYAYMCVCREGARDQQTDREGARDRQTDREGARHQQTDTAGAREPVRASERDPHREIVQPIEL